MESATLHANTKYNNALPIIIMKTYAKGAKAERDLLHFLIFKGFSTLRMPASGGDLYPLDVLALKKGFALAFEIKSWKRMPKIEKRKLEQFGSWCENAGAIGLIGWRIHGGDWKFLPLTDALNGRYEDSYWLNLTQLATVFGF